jgi:carbon storage regulator
VHMLVLTRKPEESIVIGGEIEVRVLGVQGDKVCLGVEAPRKIPVYREEVWESREADAATAAATLTGP